MSESKNRIISHMNKDHQIALVDYVVVYGHVELSSFVADSVKITDVDEEKLVLSYEDITGKKKDKTIIWSNADELEGVRVSSMKDVKAKLIAMAKYAAKKQGFSHVQIKKAIPPQRPAGYLMYVYALATVVTLYDKHLLRNLLAGTSFFGWVGTTFPSLATGFRYFEDKIVVVSLTVYAIHVIEAVAVTLPRTRKYRVPVPQNYLWLAMNFFEGFPSFLRLREDE